MAKLTHVAIVPSPGMGHLIPLAEFTRRLVLTHPTFRVTLIVPTIGQPTEAVKSILASLPITVRHVYLPPVIFDGSPLNGTPMSVAMSRSVAPLREFLKSSPETSNFSALVTDLFSSLVLDSVNDFNLRPYIFFPGNATTLSILFHIPKLDRVVSGEYRDMSDPVRAPGCIPIHGRDLPDPAQDRKSKSYEAYLAMVNRFGSVEGIMVNSFTEMEEGAIEGLRGVEGVPPVYPIGPLVNDGLSGKVDGSGCLQWLDEHLHGSVLFVSFGSGGTLSRAQMDELAYGLETSGQKFLWVVRDPDDKSANAAYFSGKTDNDPLKFLPIGFLERVRERGLVVPNWAPQPQILSHNSIGGFLTHCGWNSTLESVTNGLPLIVWPLFAEQKINAVLLSEHLNVALRPKFNENGLIGRDEIAKIVMALMRDEEGKMIRKRMKDLNDAAENAWSEEGNATTALAELTLKWSNHSIT